MSGRFVWLGASVQGLLRAAGRLGLLEDARTSKDVGGRVSVLHRGANVCAECGLQQRQRELSDDHRRLRFAQRSRLDAGHRRRQLGTSATLDVSDLLITDQSRMIYDL